MRWFKHLACSTSCVMMSAACGVSAEPQSEIIRNPYATAPAAAAVMQPAPTVVHPTWQTTARPVGLTESTKPVEGSSREPVARLLPSDHLKALRAAVQVRSTAESYRAAAASPRLDKTATWSPTQKSDAKPTFDPAVKPASWIEDAPPSGGVKPQASLTEMTAASHQEPTRLTHNPYRNGEPAVARPQSLTAPPDGANPLR